jgi:hypothetical protein
LLYRKRHILTPTTTKRMVMVLSCMTRPGSLLKASAMTNVVMLARNSSRAAIPMRMDTMITPSGSIRDLPAG